MASSRGDNDGRAGIYRFGSSVGVKLKLPRPKNCRGRRGRAVPKTSTRCVGKSPVDDESINRHSWSSLRLLDDDVTGLGRVEKRQQSAVRYNCTRYRPVIESGRRSQTYKRNECRAGRALCKVGLPRYVHTTPVTKAPKIKPQIDLLISLLAYYFRIKKLQRL